MKIILIKKKLKIAIFLFSFIYKEHFLCNICLRTTKIIYFNEYVTKFSKKMDNFWPNMTEFTFFFTKMLFSLSPAVIGAAEKNFGIFSLIKEIPCNFESFKKQKNKETKARV